MRKSQASNILQFPTPKEFFFESDSLVELKERISSVILGRFSARAEFFCSEVSDERNDGRTYKIDIHDELCPYRHVLLTPEAPLSDNQIVEIKELLVDVFIPATRMQQQSLLLKRYQQNIQQQSLPSLKPKHRPPQTPQETVAPPAEEPLNVNLRTLVLESRNTQLRHRFACNIHEVSSNFAQLNWNDVRGQMFSCADIEQMSGCTLLIENIQDLSIGESAAIWDYARNGKNGPLLIIGSPTPLDQLDDDSFNPGFLADLARRKLALDRLPLNDIDVKDLLELFLSE